MDMRPKLDKSILISDFSEFCWLKEELVSFCREEELSTGGHKIEIAKRIENFLKTGIKEQIKKNQKPKPRIKFDWKNEELLLETEITNTYSNTENVRKFFEQEIGKQFKFNVKFMNWMKSNYGKTMADAIKEWSRINSENKNNTKPKEIAPQFEYNRYLRDFMADNPGSKRELGIKLWKIKKSIRGDNIYRKEDLNLIVEK